jgi:hypothetical protein
MRLRNEKIKLLEETLNDLGLVDNNSGSELKQIKTNNLINNILKWDSTDVNNKENIIINNKLTTSASNCGDYNLLKDECTQLKIRIQAIEDEMKKFLKFFNYLK